MTESTLVTPAANGASSLFLSTSRPPPLSPPRFRQLLHAGLSSGSLAFSNHYDAQLVPSLYAQGGTLPPPPSTPPPLCLFSFASLLPRHPISSLTLCPASLRPAHTHRARPSPRCAQPSLESSPLSATSAAPRLGGAASRRLTLPRPSRPSLLPSSPTFTWAATRSVMRASVQLLLPCPTSARSAAFGSRGTVRRSPLLERRWCVTRVDSWGRMCLRCSSLQEMRCSSVGRWATI